jgi:large subunit ribosomal protein L29
MAKQARPDDLRQQKTEDLELKLAQLVEERFRLQFRRATEAIPNPLQFRTMRRDIARIKTILKEREKATA